MPTLRRTGENKMRIAIGRKGDEIITIKEYIDIKDKGEIAHFISELELIKLDLLEIWEQYIEENLD